MQVRSFSREFNAHWAVQQIVSTAQGDGKPVCPDLLASGLAADHPEFSPAELTRMICAAAIDAGVTVVPPQPVSATGVVKRRESPAGM
jgi:hypothetical protein